MRMNKRNEICIRKKEKKKLKVVDNNLVDCEKKHRHVNGRIKLNLIPTSNHNVIQQTY